MPVTPRTHPSSPVTAPCRCRLVGAPLRVYRRRVWRAAIGSGLALALTASGIAAQSEPKRASCKRGAKVECVETQEAESARRRGITATQSNLSRSAPVAM
ncbi:MAG TPA: hypothetical protein VKA39_11600, partial [Beijerinckiaceae bacterium]|nr:hypothetical protein [Beijerinckiaceae bacterium]